MRERVTTSFRLAPFAEDGQFYIDPRLPPSAPLPVLDALDRAQREVGTRLGLRPAPPLVFVYADRQLMKASACINEDVVAFYVGALLVVSIAATSWPACCTSTLTTPCSALG